MQNVSTRPVKEESGLAAKGTPLERAKGLYLRFPGERTFQQDLEAHLRNGYVISTPEFLLMGRAVARSGRPEEIRNPNFAFASERCDTWFVFLFSGTSRNFLQYVPYPLEWLAWDRARGSKLRFYKFNQMAKRCAQMTHCKTRSI